MVRWFVPAMLALAAPAAAQPILDLPPPAMPTRTAAQALAEDAQVYAARYRVPLDAAFVRLRAQQASVVNTDRIAAAYRDRLAGITIEHVPAYRIVVLLTDDVPVPDETIDAGGLAVPIVFRSGAPATREAILAAIAAHQSDLRAALIDPPGMGADPATGRLLVAVGASDAALEDRASLEARLAAIAGVPVRVTTPGRDADMAIVGGGRLESPDPATHRVLRCTSAYVVTDGTRTGLATAAHCPDAPLFVDDDHRRTPLPMIGAWGAGYQDVQIHATPGPLAPLFRAGPDPAGLRAVTSWRLRASLRAGEFVCHQGLTSGYSCAEVRMADYAPPGDLCAGPCPPAWIVVDGPDCRRGDSGGPVFAGGIAIAILKGGSYRADGSCAAYYAMSVDYLPSGWTLLHTVAP